MDEKKPLEDVFEILKKFFSEYEEDTKIDKIKELEDELKKKPETPDSEAFDEFFKKVEELFGLSIGLLESLEKKKKKVVVESETKINEKIKKAKNKIKLLEITNGSFDSANAYGNITFPFQNWDWLAVISGGEFRNYAFHGQSGIVNVNGGMFKKRAFYRQSGIVNVNGGMFKKRAFYRQSGIVNVNNGEFRDFAFCRQSGIVKVNEGRFRTYGFSRQSGIVEINGGTFGSYTFYKQSGIVNVNGGTFGKNAFHEQFGIVEINGGTFKGENISHSIFHRQRGIVKINNGEFKGSAFSEQSGIVEINGGTFGSYTFFEQSGIVEINGGTFGSYTFYHQNGFVKINGGELIKTRGGIAKSMHGGLLYIASEYQSDVGGMDSEIERGVVIAPYKVERIWNKGGTVFVTKDAKVYGNSIIFSGKTEVKGKEYYSNDVLKAFGDYVWEKVNEEFLKVESKEWDSPSSHRDAESVVYDIKIKLRPKEMYGMKIFNCSLWVDVNEMLKNYKEDLEGLEESEVEKGIGEAVYNYFADLKKKLE